MCILYDLWLHPNNTHNFNLTVGIIIQARADTHFLICTSEKNHQIKNKINLLVTLVVIKVVKVLENYCK